MEQTQNFNLRRVIDDAVRVITQPVDFYRGMGKTGGYAEPVIFVIVMAVALGLLLTVFSLFGGGRLGGMAMGWAAFIVFPIFAVIGSFIGGAILFVIWKLMGSEEPFETAYRCVAFATAIYPVMGLLSLIPYLGTIVGVVWGMYLMITASVEVHQRQRNNALLVFGILGALLLLFNISGERRARQFDAHFAQLEQSADKLEEKSPEEAGKAVGEFLKGMEKGMEKQK